MFSYYYVYNFFEHDRIEEFSENFELKNFD